jgi:hypothetical protein
MQVLQGGKKSEGHKERLTFREFQGRAFQEFTQECQEDEKEVMERKRANIFAKGSTRDRRRGLQQRTKEK